MNKPFVAVGMFMSLLMMASGVQASVTVQSWRYNGGNLGDTYVASEDTTSNHGSISQFYYGYRTDTKVNTTAFIKFSINSSILPSNSKITSAFLYLWVDSVEGGTNIANLSVFGLNNYTWKENVVSWLDYNTSMVGVDDINLISYNSSLTSSTSGIFLINVTTWVSSVLSSGYQNVSFLLNFSQSFVNSGWAKITSKEEISQVRYQPYLNITYEEIILFSPSNTTYYNNFSLPLNVTNKTFNADKWFYSLNNGNNISFTPNTTIDIQIGDYFLMVWVNDTSNNWYNKNLNFRMSIVCNATWNNVSICTGENSLFSTPCLYENGKWQFSNSNITRCTGMCKNGFCVTLPTVCNNQCNVSADQKSCGGVQNTYSINCTYDSNGCSIWNPFNVTYCRYGCFSGVCLNCTNECKIGESKCVGEYSYNCVQDMNCTKWDLTNGTYCGYGCNQNYSAADNMRFDYCNYHSFNDTYIWAKSVWVLGKSINFVFPESRMRDRAFVVLMVAIIIAIILMFVTKSWMIGLLAAIGMLWIGAFSGWFDWFQLAIFTLVVVFIIWFATKNQGGETT